MLALDEGRHNAALRISGVQNVLRCRRPVRGGRHGCRYDDGLLHWSNSRPGADAGTLTACTESRRTACLNEDGGGQYQGKKSSTHGILLR